jgi:uncharacterized membrane protein YphA (DoxX/SURF4 family)
MRDPRKLGVLLWILQWVLALFFALGSGLPKLILPLDTLPMPLPLPELFLRVVGVAEVLGGVGLLLPGLLRIRPGLTPLAAAGLVVIMIGATVLTAMGVGGSDPVSALFPLVVGLLAAFVAYGRWRLVPQRRTARAAVLQAA